MKRDKQLTAAAGFTDPKSYVAPDGREILFGIDWGLRKQQLMDRSDGRCEYFYDFPSNTPKARCSAEGAIPAHIEPRYPKRDDRLSNLKNYCLVHDRLMEKQNWRRIRSDRAERRAHENTKA